MELLINLLGIEISYDIALVLCIALIVGCLAMMCYAIKLIIWG